MSARRRFRPPRCQTGSSGRKLGDLSVYGRRLHVAFSVEKALKKRIHGKPLLLSFCSEARFGLLRNLDTHKAAVPLLAYRTAAREPA
jgi:hypothetical protein